MDTKVLELTISTPAFQPDGMIDPKYTCDGSGINPPLQINNIPAGTQSLALIVEDPDAPSGTYDHWIVWNIEPTSQIKEKSNPGTSGNNSAGKTGYHPPCPPSGTHRYYFYVFALDAELHLAPGESKTKLQQAMNKHILAKGNIMGKYRRHNS